MRVVTRFTPICDADGVATNCAEKFVDLSEGKPRYTVGAVFFQVEFEIEQARDLSGKVIALGRYNAVPGSPGVFEGVGQLRPVSGKSRVLHRCDVTSCPRPPELAFVPGGPSFDFGTVVAPNRPFVDMTLMNIGEAELGELPTGLECWLDGAGAARFSIDAANSSCLTPARTLAGGASCTVRVYFEGDDLPEPAGPTPYTSRLHCRGQNNFPPLVETAIGHDMMGIWEPAATATPSPTPTPTPTPTSTPAPTSTPTPTPAPTALPTPTPTPLAEAVLLLSAPDPVDFGVQTSQTERVVTLSNIGKSAITSPISVTFDGGGAGGLSLGGTSTCIHGVTVLTAGQSCTFVVVFNPVGLPAGQAVFGSLSVSANKTSSALTGDSSAILATAGPLPSGKLLVEVSGGTTVSSGVISGVSGRCWMSGPFQVTCRAETDGIPPTPLALPRTVVWKGGSIAPLPPVPSMASQTKIGTLTAPSFSGSCGTEVGPSAHALGRSFQHIYGGNLVTGCEEIGHITYDFSGLTVGETRTIVIEFTEEKLQWNGSAYVPATTVVDNQVLGVYRMDPN